VLGPAREAGATLERPAPDDPHVCEPGKPAPRTRAKLFRLTTEATLRFWATGGPYPDLSGRFPPVALRVSRGCPGEPGSTIVACGDTLAADLPAGKYFVTVVASSTHAALAENPPPGAFTYRLATAGDTQCPESLATRRLDDWMGEALPQRRELADLNGDARNDVAVEYRAASNQSSTRVLVADDYPRCLRTVLDAEVTLTLDGGASGGWKHLRTTSWAPSPSGIIEDSWVVHRTTFDARLGRYVEGKRLGCSDGPSPDARSVRCREP
jgi:hypothetical protein